MNNIHNISEFFTALLVGFFRFVNAFPSVCFPHIPLHVGQLSGCILTDPSVLKDVFAHVIGLQRFRQSLLSREREREMW